MYQPNYWILERSYCFLPKWTTGDREWKWGVRLGYRVSLLGLYTCSFGLVWPEVTSKAGATVPPPRWSERASIRAKMECAWMLLVGRDVSVRLGLGGLPGRGGMRWVWDGGDAVGQGQRSSHNALHSCPSSRQPARCYANQPCGEPTTETCFHSLKYADTVKARAVTINQYRIDSWIVSDIFRMHRILSGIDSELRF